MELLSLIEFKHTHFSPSPHPWTTPLCASTWLGHEHGGTSPSALLRSRGSPWCATASGCAYGLHLHAPAATSVEVTWAMQPACGVALVTVKWLWVSRVSHLLQIQQDPQCPELNQPPQPTWFLSWTSCFLVTVFPQVSADPHPPTSPHPRGIHEALCLSTSLVHTAVQNSEDL